MKIGLVIKITNGGIAEALSINKDDNWARFTDDVRPAINVLNNFDGTGKSILLVKFLGNLGYLLALVKSRPEGSGRGGDNTAAWIHIPSKCDLPDSQMESVLQKVETAISASKGIDREILDEVFNINYNAKDVLSSAVGTIASKNDADYAVRYYGRGKDFVLKELLGTFIAQQEYANYKGIIFIDAEKGITANCRELNFEPKKIRTFHPLENIDGFTASFLLRGNYVPYNKPIEIPIGAKIQIYWVKQGYSPIVKSIMAQDNDSCLKSLKIRTDEYFISVARTIFKVSTADGKPISDFEVSINNKLMDGNDLEIPEADFNRGVLLCISAKGYSEWRKDNVDLRRNIEIRLQKRVYHYEFEIPVYVRDGNINYALATYKTHHSLKKSPIEGYSLCDYHIYEGQGHVNRVFYNNRLRYKLKYFCIGVASCLLMFLLWAGWQALDNYEFNLGWPPFKEIKQQPQTQWGNSEEDFVENVDSLNAVAYLENNSTWHKDSLDKYEATRGLFEELNEFKNDDISRKVEKLGNVQKLEDIINAFNNSPYDHHIGKEANNGNYNSPTDNGISVDNYIKWISQQHFTEVSHPAPTPEPVSAPKTNKSKITGKTQKPANSASTTIKPATEQSQKPKRGGVN